MRPSATVYFTSVRYIYTIFLTHFTQFFFFTCLPFVPPYDGHRERVKAALFSLFLPLLSPSHVYISLPRARYFASSAIYLLYILCTLQHVHKHTQRVRSTCFWKEHPAYHPPGSRHHTPFSAKKTPTFSFFRFVLLLMETRRKIAFRETRLVIAFCATPHNNLCFMIIYIKELFMDCKFCCV